MHDTASSQRSLQAVEVFLWIVPWLRHRKPVEVVRVPMRRREHSRCRRWTGRNRTAQPRRRGRRLALAHFAIARLFFSICCDAREERPVVCSVLPC